MKRHAIEPTAIASVNRIDALPVDSKLREETMHTYEVKLGFHGIECPEKFCVLPFKVRAENEGMAMLKATRTKAAQSRGAVHVESVKLLR